MMDKMTVGQLIELLSKYPSDMEIKIGYEGCFNRICKENIYQSKDFKIYMDVDSYMYKKEYAKDPKENE